MFPHYCMYTYERENIVPNIPTLLLLLLLLLFKYLIETGRERIIPKPTSCFPHPLETDQRQASMPPVRIRVLR